MKASWARTVIDILREHHDANGTAGYQDKEAWQTLRAMLPASDELLDRLQSAQEFRPDMRALILSVTDAVIDNPGTFEIVVRQFNRAVEEIIRNGKQYWFMELPKDFDSTKIEQFRKDWFAAFDKLKTTPATETPIQSTKDRPMKTIIYFKDEQQRERYTMLDDEGRTIWTPYQIGTAAPLHPDHDNELHSRVLGALFVYVRETHAGGLHPTTLINGEKMINWTLSSLPERFK